MNKNIVVLGGGYSGVLTAKKLEKKLRRIKNNEVSITLIDKNPFHTMLTELHEVAADRVEEESIKMNLKKIFAGRKVDIVLDCITSVDFENKTITGEQDTYSYDYLVMGTGSKPAFFNTPGAKENTFTLWSFDDAIKLREHILSCFRLAEKTVDKKTREALLSFFVVGGGFTGVEMMGELAEWVPELCEKFNIKRSEIKLSMADMLDRILVSIPENLASKAEKRLKKNSVAIFPNSKVCNVKENGIDLNIGGVDGGACTFFPSKTVIWTAGIEGSEVISSSDIQKTRGARIETDEYLKSKEYPNVYIVGDNIFYIPPGEEKPVPQMVENCEASADCAAKNLFADITGGSKKEKYEPKFHGMMVSVGGRFGTAYVGTHKKKFGLPSFLAMFSKHFINLLYFINVLGWNKIYSYIQHEFLRVRNNRSFVGGYFSNYSPNFWSVPLRIFLGISWILSGYEKLLKIIDNFYYVFLFPTTASDGVTSATVAAANATPLPVPEFLKIISDWVLFTFISPIGPYFQAFMIISEIIIGLMILGGLFTSFAAIAASAMCVMIYLSGWADVSLLWYFAASVSFIGIGGTGQTFALDYYVLPWLKKFWKKLGFVKKWYIYND